MLIYNRKLAITNFPFIRLFRFLYTTQKSLPVRTTEQGFLLPIRPSPATIGLSSMSKGGLPPCRI